MAPNIPDIKYALIPLCLLSSAFGFYASLGSLLHNGFVPVMDAVCTGSRSTLLGAPEPFKRSYVGVEAMDHHLCSLVGFFSALVDGDVPVEDALFYLWGMAQFCAGWSVLLLESIRDGNRGGVVGLAAVGVWGLLVQNLAWTTTLPIYLIAYLLSSPLAETSSTNAPAASKSLLPSNLWDVALIPLSVLLSFVLPAALMSMPSLLHQSASTHYALIALWQFFPLWNVLLLLLLRTLSSRFIGPLQPVDGKGNLLSPGQGYMAVVGGVYRFILTTLLITHLPLLDLSLAPEAVREVLAAYFPSLAALFTRATFANVFVPKSPFSPPEVHPTAYVSGELAPLATHFLRFDIYVPALAFVAWAVYMYQGAISGLGRKGEKDGRERWQATAKKVAFWLVLGGPYAPVVTLLWDRDRRVLEGGEEEKGVKSQ